MKKVILALMVISFLAVSCNSENKPAESTVNGAAIHFEKNSYDFGKINEGEKVSHDFEFTNNGTEPLIISDASASCGCTVPEYPKEPVTPGKKGLIKVVFDSEGNPGMQHKVVTLTSNSNPATTEIYVTGEVKAKEIKSN